MTALPRHRAADQSAPRLDDAVLIERSWQEPEAFAALYDLDPGAQLMNDLDLVRNLRAIVPAPAPVRLAALRRRFLAAALKRRRFLGAALQRRRRFVAAPLRPRRYWRVALLAAAVAATAGVAVVAVLGGTATSSRPRPGPAQRVSLAAQILGVAARTVASEPSARPGDRQWINSRFVQTETGQATQSDENWARFDGLEQAYYLNGQLIVHPETSGRGGPLDSYRELAALPATSSAILAAARAAVGTTPRQWENWSSGSVVAELAPRSVADAEFDYLAQLLWNAYAAAPSAALAHVYQALADIPGVRVARGQTNAVGRAGIGVSANGGVSWLLLDPQTYQVIGVNERAVSPRPANEKAGPLTFSGTISMAWARVAVVAAPGQR